MKSRIPKKISKLLILVMLPVVTFLTLGILVVQGLTSGILWAEDYKYSNGGLFIVGSNSAMRVGGKAEISGYSAEYGGGIYVKNGGTFKIGLEVGDVVEFGEYPNTVKSDDVTIKLSSVDENGYYLGSDGNRYAQVVATPDDDDYVFSDGDIVQSGTTYYFKVEPIKWTYLGMSENGAILVAKSILDAQTFDDSSNNYESSNVRTWLNSTFFDLAFTDADKKYIVSTEVDNSASTTNSTTNSYVCNNTTDNVYLLSYQDVLNSEYGFSSTENENIASRRKRTTDYAVGRGAFYKDWGDVNYMWHGVWLTRSPYSGNGSKVNYVESAGHIDYASVNVAGFGVAPAITVSYEFIFSMSNNTAELGGGFYIENGGTFIMNGGVIFGNTATSGNGSNIYNAGTLTINGGVVGEIADSTEEVTENEVEESEDIYGIYNSGTMTILDGEINDDIYVTTTDGVSEETLAGTLEISGGVVNGNIVGVQGTTIILRGGTVNGKITTGGNIIIGKDFSYSGTINLISPGYVTLEDYDGSTPTFNIVVNPEAIKGKGYSEYVVYTGSYSGSITNLLGCISLIEEYNDYFCFWNLSSNIMISEGVYFYIKSNSLVGTSTYQNSIEINAQTVSVAPVGTDTVGPYCLLPGDGLTILYLNLNNYDDITIHSDIKKLSNYYYTEEQDKANVCISFTIDEDFIIMDHCGQTFTIEINGSSAVKYYYHYYANEGTFSDTSDTSWTYNDDSARRRSATFVAPASPTREGYVFAGWYTGSSGGTQVVGADGTLNSSVSGYTDSSGTWTRTSTTTLYAHWTLANYSVTFNANGGTFSDGTTTQTKSVGLTVGELPKPTRSGYVLSGWYTLATGGTKVTETTTVSSDATYYAHWKEAYDITFNANGGTFSDGTTMKTISLLKNATIGTFSNSPTRKETNCEYEFDGWYTASSGGTQVSTTTTVTAKRTYYAHWKTVYQISGDYVYFGWYPQTLKSDSVTITSTTNSNGYYLGSDGNWYAKVVSDNGSISSSGSYIYVDTTYYFKVELIKWKKLKTNSDGSYLLVCENAIDWRYFNDTDDVRNGLYANNYQYSDIRAWLNSLNTENGSGKNYSGSTSGFLNIAFSSTQQKYISTTTISTYTCIYSSSDLSIGSSSAKEIETKDKIFLLDLYSNSNTANGALLTYFSDNSSRKRNATDYVRTYYCEDYTHDKTTHELFVPWWSRSVSNFGSGSSMPGLSHIEKTGSYYGRYNPHIQMGIVPALVFNSNGTSTFTSNQKVDKSEEEKELTTRTFSTLSNIDSEILLDDKKKSGTLLFVDKRYMSNGYEAKNFQI